VVGRSPCLSSVLLITFADSQDEDIACRITHQTCQRHSTDQGTMLPEQKNLISGVCRATQQPLPWAFRLSPTQQVGRGAPVCLAGDSLCKIRETAEL
jgi:hypothetical protein